MPAERNITWYARWIGANALGELLGLGATFAIGIGLFSAWQPRMTAGIILQALAMTASGLLEGFVVGTLQWRVLRSRVAVRRRAWVWATIIGGVVAWAAGTVPMTLGAFADAAGGAVSEPAGWVMVLLEMGLGLAGGTVLSLAQFAVLRKAVRRAGWWLPANALAWALAMPVIFAAVDLAYTVSPLAVAVEVMAAALLIAGGVVGAVHGLALVRLTMIQPDEVSHEAAAGPA